MGYLINGIISAKYQFVNNYGALLKNSFYRIIQGSAILLTLSSESFPFTAKAKGEIMKNQTTQTGNPGWKFCTTAPLESDNWSFNVRNHRFWHRQWLWLLIATVISGLTYYLIIQRVMIGWLHIDTQWTQMHPNVLPGLAAVIAFIGGTTLGLLITMAATRFLTVLKAFGEIRGAVIGIILNLNSVDVARLRNELFRTFRRILRAMCAKACRENFVVCVKGPVREKEYENTLIPLLEIFRELLAKAGIENIVIGNNGRLHVILNAQASVELTVSIPLPISLYLAVGSMLLILCLVFSAFVILFGGAAWALLGTAFTAVLGGAISAVMFIASNRANPFRGTRPSDIRPRTFTKGLDQDIDVAVEVRSIMLPHQELPA